jgi:hypothetical protein
MCRKKSKVKIEKKNRKKNRKISKKWQTTKILNTFIFIN